jgi:phage tail-like protein
MPALDNTLDDAIAGGYFDLQLSGLETLKFSDVSGLRHSVDVTGRMLTTPQGGQMQDARVVGSPQPMDLTCTYVVLQAMDLWTWLDTLIQRGASDTTAKEGNLFIRSIATSEAVATWKLQQVFLTQLSLNSMGANTPEYLVANLVFRVGECEPM